MNEKLSQTLCEFTYKNQSYIPYFNTIESCLGLKKCQQWNNLFSNTNEFLFNDFPINKNVFLQVKKEGTFKIELLFITPVHSDKVYLKIDTFSTELEVKKISDSYNDKFVILEYDNNYIHIRASDLIYMNFGYNYQFLYDYYDSHDISLKKKLHLGKEYFLFEYNDFYNYYCNKISCEEIKKLYLDYIDKYKFDFTQVKNIFKYEKELNDIIDDPKEYILQKCREFMGKYIDNELKRTITFAYYTAISQPQKTWKELYETFWSVQKTGQPEQFVNKKLAKFKDLARENEIPYIPAIELRDMTEETRPKIIEEMISQLKVLRGIKSGDVNF